MKRLLIVPAMLALAACSTVTTGTKQTVFVDTPQVKGASCKLTDSKQGSWYLESTPGSVTVQKGDGPMNIICEKDGYEQGLLTFDEDFQGATLGNIIIGGGVGFLVDAMSGAAQKYPDKVTVWMRPDQWMSESQKVAWLQAKEDFDRQQKEAEEKKKQQEQAQ